MKKLLGLVILMALPFFTYAQVRNTGVRIRLKGPIYEDAVLLIHKNLIMVRTEAPFYIYSYAQDRYKTTPSTPVLLGLRYERLGAADISLGADLEYVGYDAKKLETDVPKDVPKTQQIIKFSPFIKKYFRSNRKAIFRGLALSGGLTYMSVAQIVDDAALLRKVYQYNRADVLGATVGLNIQHTIGPYFTVGIGADATICGSQFKQETFIRTDVGNGAIYINPFKFYIGGHF